MKLGTASQIAISTNDLEASTIVYDKIGFKRIGHGDIPNKYIQYTDDSTVILLNEDGMESIGFIYFGPNMQLVVDELKRRGTSFIQETDDAFGKFFQGVFITPDGVAITLVNFDPGTMFQPKHTLAGMSEEDLIDSSKYPNHKIGVFGEYSVPVKDLQASLRYWKSIGFEALSIKDEPYPWAIVTDGLNIIGLHQTTEFTRQAITYFAPDMKRRIENLRNDGLDDNIDGFIGTGGGDNNVVLTTMENQKFFLFSF
jgi:predicted lactoylglutathione lyase